MVFTFGGGVHLVRIGDIFGGHGWRRSLQFGRVASKCGDFPVEGKSRGIGFG